MTQVDERSNTDSSASAGLPRLDEASRAPLFTDARTANDFTPIPVTDGDLAGIWELAKWGPSAANSQPLRVLYVRTPEGRARLVEQMSEGNRAKTAAAPATAILALDSDLHEHVPTILAGYFIVAVRAHGLAAGPMAGFDAAGVDREFFPDGRWKSILVVNIGHPAQNAWFDRLPRLDHADAVPRAKRLALHAAVH